MIDSFTSPTIDDYEFDEDNSYMWDCCNIDYCKKYRKKEVKGFCLKGSQISRCNREVKLQIRQNAHAKGFIFPSVSE